jgi:DNA polymerase III subunit epsilon
MLLLGIDFETTGLNPEIDSIIEVGMVFWDKVSGPVRLDNFLVNHDIQLDPAITDITGITTSMCEDYGRAQAVGLKYVMQWVAAADILVAHNAPFDREFLRNWCLRNEIEFPTKIWIDTNLDLNSQMNPRFSRKLVYMAADHGFLNPFPHRAVFDVMAMLQVLSKYDLDETIRYSQLPSIEIEAVSKYEQKDLVKAAGYRWFGETKQWKKIIKQDTLELEQTKASEAGFRVGVLSGS